jgi:hypothetical protein
MLSGRRMMRSEKGREHMTSSSRRSASFDLAASILVLCFTTASTGAENADETEEITGAGGRSTADGELAVENVGRSSRPAGNVPGLDALLQIPNGFVTNEPEEVAGAGESEWRRRFTKADREMAEALASLEATKRELEGLAVGGSSSQWSIAPPGGESGPTTSPMSFKLRQQLRGDRDLIDIREKAKRELRIEADLAGVPQSWRVGNSNSEEALPN